MFIAIDLEERRLALALELGATEAINPANIDTAVEVSRLAGGGVNFSFETTGSMKVLRQAVDCLSSLGVCGFVGGSPVGSELPLNVRHVMSRGKCLRGRGRRCQFTGLHPNAHPAQQGRFPFDRLLTFYAFDDIQQAIADSVSGRCVKAVLRFPDAEPPRATAA